MFIVSYVIDGVKFAQNCASEKERDDLVIALKGSDIEPAVIKRPEEEPRYMVVSCMFRASDETVYTFVDPNGNARPGKIVEVEVVNNFGQIEIKRAFVTSVRMEPVSAIRAIANKLNRKKLGKVVKVR